jgi:hypothetical protein
VSWPLYAWALSCSLSVTATMAEQEAEQVAPIIRVGVAVSVDRARIGAMRSGLFTIIREAKANRGAKADIDRGGGQHWRRNRRGPWSGMLCWPAMHAYGPCAGGSSQSGRRWSAIGGDGWQASGGAGATGGGAGSIFEVRSTIGIELGRERCQPVCFSFLLFFYYFLGD